MMDASGNVVNSYTYDQFGAILEQTEGTYNPFKYAGELHDMPDNLIYLRNRIYDPKIGRFLTEDPIKDGTNWYVYCNNNPVNCWDPLGLIPSDIEAAYMADHIYNATSADYFKDFGKSFGGWCLKDIIDEEEGLYMGVYYRTVDGITEYALVNKGTTKNNKVDWKNNIQQPFGFSTDMKNSIAEAQNFVNNHKNSEVTMVGHSKGGAEAVANAVATNTNCIVFNPATTFLQSYDLSADNYNANMYVYAVKGEPLTSLESFFSKPIDRYIELEAEPLPERKWWQVKKIIEDLEYLHSMDAVIWGLNKYYK